MFDFLAGWYSSMPCLFTKFCSDGRGLVDTYSVFPGIELSFNYYYANCFEFLHRPVHSAMQINHCRSGRMVWKMQDQSTKFCVEVISVDACFRKNVWWCSS